MSNNDYNSEVLERLWKKSYRDLATSPGEAAVGFTEARFIMQAKLARATHRYALVTTVATLVIAVATVVNVVIAFYKP